MKTLQEHFTTPEQARDLLELGVPANSADCYRLELGADLCTEPIYLILPLDRCMTPNAIPCWSVGRLMEIFDICNLYELHKFSTRDWSVNIKKLMRDYEVAAEENMLDFSKLEE